MVFAWRGAGSPTSATASTCRTQAPPNVSPSGRGSVAAVAAFLRSCARNWTKSCSSVVQPARAAASTQPWSTRMPLLARAACMLLATRARISARGRLANDYFMSAATRARRLRVHCPLARAVDLEAPRDQFEQV